MSLPTYHDHRNGIGIDFLDRRPYLARYLEAKELSPQRYGELARLAFNLVQAQFRLSDISQTISPHTDQKVAAQHGEVVGWQAKIDRYTDGRPGSAYVLREMIGDFSCMAAEARQPDESERELIALGQAGRINEVVVATIDEPYSWQYGPSDARDSAFAG